MRKKPVYDGWLSVEAVKVNGCEVIERVNSLLAGLIGDELHSK